MEGHRLGGYRFFKRCRHAQQVRCRQAHKIALHGGHIVAAGHHACHAALQRHLRAVVGCTHRLIGGCQRHAVGPVQRRAACRGLCRNVNALVCWQQRAVAAEDLRPRDGGRRIIQHRHHDLLRGGVAPAVGHRAEHGGIHIRQRSCCGLIVHGLRPHAAVQHGKLADGGAVVARHLVRVEGDLRFGISLHPRAHVRYGAVVP